MATARTTRKKDNGNMNAKKETTMNARITTTILTLLLAATATFAEIAYPVAWTAQIGSSDEDYGYSVAVDAFGNAYISGYTEGDLGGPNAGEWDAFLSKFDACGNAVWTTQIGTSSGDRSSSVAVNASGDVYISGYTGGDLGGPSAGSSDAFLSRFDPSGNELWTTQIGTSSGDNSSSVAVDASGDVYISGSTGGDLGGPTAGGCDAFLSKFDASGNEVWSTQIGTASTDASSSVAVDAFGNAYISGYTEGDLGGPNAGGKDAFLSKFDPSGTELWTTQIGTSSYDYSYGVAVDASGDVYISGRTLGDLGGPNAGGEDAFLSKFDPSGTELWTTQIGTGLDEASFAVAVDASGNAYISGYFDYDPDALLVKLDSAGNEVWTTWIGTDPADISWSVAVDASGNIYISGWTWGDLGGPNAGPWDAFLVKYEVPEPATLSLLALGGLAMLRRKRKQTTSKSETRTRRSRTMLSKNISQIAIVMIALCLAVAAPAQAGIRADLSGDAVIDFATTMDLPLMTVGNPGNAGESSGYTEGGARTCGGVDYVYRIGKFEVTAGQYTEFLNAVADTDTYGLYNTSMSDVGCRIQRSGSSGSYTYSVAADWADRPVNYVSWLDSARFANWLTNGMPTGVQGLATTENGSYFINGAMSGPELLAVTRKDPEDGGRYYIPTEDEWYKAAYHKNDGVTGNYFNYPTRSDFDGVVPPISGDTVPSNDLIDPDPGNNANFDAFWGGYTIGSPYWRTEVGEFENSYSPYGTFDMGGNVSEWNEAWIYGAGGEIEYESFRCWRGASCGSDFCFLLAELRHDQSFAPTTCERSDVGFRVSEVPEPATLSLLALGACLPLFRRKKR